MSSTLSTFSHIIEILGIITFTISGVYAALEKKLDIFGVTIIAFVTATGGGTIRDILIGATPVAWMRDLNSLAVILVTVIVTLLFKKRLGNLHKTLLFFDALGLGLFTVIGIRKGLAIHLNPGICIALGTITGCFGGVVRDILLNRIPALFHTKEIYATACIAGGSVYLLLTSFVAEEVAQSIAVVLICAIRIISYSQNWKLPSV